jgi:hypothetical protein
MLSLKETPNARKIARIIDPKAKGIKNKKGKYKKPKDKFLWLCEHALDSEDVKFDDVNMKEIKLPKGQKLQPLPNKNIVEKIYVSAPSGAGKSTWAGAWLGEFKKMFKHQDIYVFSSIDEDKELDRHEPLRIELNLDIIDDPMKADEIEDSVAVFDDVDTIQNPHLRGAIGSFRDYLLEQGRHFNIRMLMTSHLLMNYQHTRRILNEASAVVFFPKSGSTYSIKRFLKYHAGLENEEIKKVLNLPSRWVAFYKTYPLYIMHERGAYLLCPANNEF